MTLPAQGTYDVEIEEVDYLHHDGEAYPAKIFKPVGDGPFPAVVEVHGGAWSKGDRTTNDAINSAVARGGVVVAALEFRNAPQAPYPGSVADVNYGVRWLKAEAARFGTAPHMVGTMGTSSGGHLAVLAAIKPDDMRYASIPLPGAEDQDATAAFVVTLWPVICPASRYRTLQARLDAGEQNDRWPGLLEGQLSYWLSEDAMEEGSPNFAVQRGDALSLPPILYLQNPEDRVHPREHMESFIAGYRAMGGSVQQELFDGEHMDAPRSAAESDSGRAVVSKIIAFAHAQAKAG